MSQTITLSPAARTPPIYFSRLRSPSIDIQERLSDFLKQMRTSGLFNEEKMREWEVQFSGINFNNIDEREDHAFLLSIFLAEVIHPTSANAFIDDFKKIIKLVLPDAIAVERLIAECICYDKELKTIFSDEELEKSSRCLEKSKRNLLREANQSNQETRVYYESEKRELFALTELQVSMAEELEREIDGLEEELTEVALEGVSLVQKVEKLEARIEAVDIRNRQTLDKCKNVFKKA